MRLTNLWPILLAALAVLALALIAAIGRRVLGSQSGSIKARAPLTRNEQTMYFRLVQALPEYVVLAQVAFSALLTSKHRGTRNRFDRKVADFVICTKSFAVVAVIELDDSSHAGREANDKKREALLTDAGYRVLRYSRVPDVDRLQADLPQPTMAK